MGGLAAGGGLALLGLGTAVSLAEAEPAAPIDPWDRALGYWESTKKALGSGTSWWGGSSGSQGPIPLPTDKLRCAVQPYGACIWLICVFGWPRAAVELLL